MNQMVRLGLTGGIACGKSTASAVFKELGVPVLDADQVARDVVQYGSEGLNEIVEHFGNEVLHSNGTLNREKLRTIVFSEPEAKKILETITHPKIFTAMNQWQVQQADKGAAVTIVDAALMVETGTYQIYDGLIVVSCFPEIQLNRLMNRNQVSLKTAEQWIQSQLPLSEKEALADWVINNNHSIKTLTHQIHSHWPNFLASVHMQSQLNN